jgi:hypothetical protein
LGSRLQRQRWQQWRHSNAPGAFRRRPGTVDTKHENRRATYWHHPETHGVPAAWVMQRLPSCLNPFRPRRGRRHHRAAVEYSRPGLVWGASICILCTHIESSQFALASSWVQITILYPISSIARIISGKTPSSSKADCHEKKEEKKKIVI